MSEKDVNNAARAIYEHMMGDDLEQRPWEDALPSQKTFYRRLAKWHLQALNKAVKEETWVVQTGCVSAMQGLIENAQTYLERYLDAVKA